MNERVIKEVIVSALYFTRMNADSEMQVEMLGSMLDKAALDSLADDDERATRFEELIDKCIEFIENIT